MSKGDQKEIHELLQTPIDKVIHEPARLKILLFLNSVESADFIFLLRKIGLSKGNLSSHISKLENEGYVYIDKSFIDKVPRTIISITEQGQKALYDYQKTMVMLLNLVDEKR